MSKPLGDETRGTTNPNRLRRVDRWIAWWCAHALTSARDPLIIDLGFGATPITAIELRDRLAAVRRDVRVVGLEISPERVAFAQQYADAPSLSFELGGFELAGMRPIVVRALNVLRQYDESAVRNAWRTMSSALAPGGWLVEGTCDELGRLCTWVALRAGERRPISLTLSAKLSTLESPLAFAERLPKSLIHHNVPGEPVHTLLSNLDTAWRHAAPYNAFGLRQRWLATIRSLGATTLDGPRRWRLGEVTFPYPQE